MNKQRRLEVEAVANEKNLLIQHEQKKIQVNQLNNFLFFTNKIILES